MILLQYVTRYCLRDSKIPVELFFHVETPDIITGTSLLTHTHIQTHSHTDSERETKR